MLLLFSGAGFVLIWRTSGSDRWFTAIRGVGLVCLAVTTSWLAFVDVMMLVGVIFPGGIAPPIDFLLN